jgi:disulfide bond formation protein DsbB
MWKLALIPIVLIGVAVGIFVCWASVEIFLSPEYTYQGDAEMTLEQYNDIKSNAVGKNTVDIMNVADDKLYVHYDFKARTKYDFLLSIGQETPVVDSILMAFCGLVVFLMVFLGSRDIYNSVKYRK